jgi:hypothetical protein
MRCVPRIMETWKLAGAFVLPLFKTLEGNSDSKINHTARRALFYGDMSSV